MRKYQRTSSWFALAQRSVSHPRASSEHPGILQGCRCRGFHVTRKPTRRLGRQSSPASSCRIRRVSIRATHRRALTRTSNGKAESANSTGNPYRRAAMSRREGLWVSETQNDEPGFDMNGQRSKHAPKNTHGVHVDAFQIGVGTCSREATRAYVPGPKPNLCSRFAHVRQRVAVLGLALTRALPPAICGRRSGG